LLVVATTDLTAGESVSLERQPALVLNGGVTFARQMFGATHLEITQTECTVGLDEAIWAAPVATLARAFGKSALRIPLAPVCTMAAGTKGTALACTTVRDGRAPQPAILQLNRCVWSLIDLGTAFANLLTESYEAHAQGAESAAARSPRLRRVAEAVYYAAPDRVRRWVQSRYYARLERRVEQGGNRCSDYPIDATGWLLIELVKRLIIHAAGGLVRIGRWPAPYDAAATVTHDVEPRRFAYTTGLHRLLDRAAVLGHPATLGLVAEASDQYLTDDAVERVRSHDVLCHGLTHRGEPVHGRARVSVSVQTARTRLERRLGRRLAGYRSPRLERSPDLAWALDHSDFQYDSSYPDVDRENIEHFGAGVRLNLPYRPLIDDTANGVRPSRCLELPLTAPDCIQPLFAGDSVETLRAAVAAKAAFVRRSGGLYVALVHAGVFGEDDAARREAHLEFVCSQLRHPEVWMASMAQIVDWWCKREALSLTARDGVVCIRNDGAQPITGVQVVTERPDGSTVLVVPPLEPGMQVSL
jgi:peptidoglycan/xylan/chitin deacetylase (PgdA/CDA1 family)